MLPILAGLFLTAAQPQPQPESSVKKIAEDSLRSLGADVPESSSRCSTCHGLSSTQIRQWGDSAMMANFRCQFDLSEIIVDGPTPTPRTPRDPLEAQKAIDCLRKDPNDSTSPFEPHTLGIYAAASHLSLFANLFSDAYGESDGPGQYEKFRKQVAMPPAHNQMTAEEFHNLKQWADMGMPLLEEIVNKIPFPDQCTTAISPKLKEHVDAMKLTGWEARNQETGLSLFACPDDNPHHCFTQRDGDGDIFPEAKTLPNGRNWSQDYPNQNLRILRELGFSTSFWMRTSADGRFVANGYSPGVSAPDAPDGDQQLHGMITDLAASFNPGRPRRDIKVKGEYDPGFFPDNSGFVFQSTPRDTGICTQSLLENLQTERILFDEPECASVGKISISLYQSVGANLEGGDYAAVTGQFLDDSGSGRLQENPWDYPFGFSSKAVFTPIIQTGQGYEALGEQGVAMPFQGDFNISPSNRMLITRLNGMSERGYSRHLGYKLHLVGREKTDLGYHFQTEEVATLCVKGRKAMMSFDEAFLVTYHYVDRDDYADLGFSSPDDPGFASYLSEGAANVILTDLSTGRVTRLTRMGPGQFALFPHFRSDGWLYFLVYDKALNKRYVVASDAAVLR